jgi:hypothetical protein
MSETSQEILAVLKELRDGQREIIAHLHAQRTLAEEQLHKSQQRVEESVGLQREALRRQRTITRVALPAIGLCFAAIAYLILRYF